MNAIEKAKKILGKPHSAWEKATLDRDGRTVRVPASATGNDVPLQNDLIQLKRAGWTLGDEIGPRGVQAFLAVAPVEAPPAPTSIAEALARVSKERVPNWVRAGIERNGSLVFDKNSGAAALMGAKSAFSKALANGWQVDHSTYPDGTTISIVFTPPEGLIQ